MGPTQRPLPGNIKHLKNIHAPGGNRISNPSNRTAARSRHRRRGYWDRRLSHLVHNGSVVEKVSRRFLIQGAAERTPLFEKRINSKPKKIWKCFFLFMESTQNAVLYQCVLNKTSLKWRPWILINWCSLSVVVHDLENYFRCNCSNFLSYRLLQSFQSVLFV